jgi:antirestriction protein ArdC
MRCYQVFNANQVKNLPKRFYPQAPLLEETIGEGERIPKADRFFAATNAQVIHGYSCAFYSFKSDYIAMPNFTEFKNVHGYYSTLAHEMIHWTGHSTRVNRELTNFADAPLSYAREELIAELGAAFLCADLGLNHEPREDHSQYIGYWIQHLRSDFKAISVAAGIAQKASQYLHSLQESIPEEVKATR